MQLGMIGLGRMGGNMVRRLMRHGHECVVFDRNPKAVQTLVKDGAVGASSLDEFVSKLEPPRAAWMMLPAAAVEDALAELAKRMQRDDIVIDGGNSYYIDDIRRGEHLQMRGIHHLDVGTSGGVWGLERGFCMMIGGDESAVKRLDPIFRALAPGKGETARTPNADAIGTTAQEGYLHCGPCGAGHFVKMVHNGIEYGIMASFAEGFNVLKHADVGQKGHEVDAETTPLRHPEHYRFEMNLPAIAEVWRRGSVVSSWLLDLIATAFAKDPKLDGFTGRVSDSGEGRWTVQAAIEQGSPAPVLSAALFQRFSSRGESEFADKLLSAMRFEFGGHEEKHD